MSVLDDLDSRDTRGFRLSCGPVAAAKVAEVSLKMPTLAARIEAVMMAGSVVRRDDGTLAPITIPPALALAIIHIVLSRDPLETAEWICKERP